MLFIPWHFPLHNDKSVKGSSEEAEKKFKKDYPDVYNHLLKFKKELLNRNQTETGIRYEWYALQRFGSNFWHEFENEKIIYQEIVQSPSFCFDMDEKFFCFDTARIITGEKLKYLLAILNSKLFFFIIKNFYGGGGLGSTGIRMKHTFFENCPVPIAKDTIPFETIVDYLIFLNDEIKPPVNPYTSNTSLAAVFEETLNMMVYQLYFEQHMKEEEIDVLRFVDIINFPSLIKNDDKDAESIGSSYKWLQVQENPIRNRIILSNIRSKDIIRRINSTTH